MLEIETLFVRRVGKKEKYLDFFVNLSPDFWHYFYEFYVEKIKIHTNFTCGDR